MTRAIKALEDCIRHEIINANNWRCSLKNRALSDDQIADRNKYLAISEADIYSYELAIEILRRENK